jgi:hypothetical protein
MKDPVEPRDATGSGSDIQKRKPEKEVADTFHELDLTKNPEEKERSGGLARPQTVAYDPAKDREWARGTIALTLVGVLAGIVVFAFIYVLISLFILKSFRDLDSLKTLLEILFSPVVGLVGAVTGFYFGEKTKS